MAQTKRRDGKALRRCFRIDRYGEDQAKAKAMAIAERQRQLAEIDHRIFRGAKGEAHYARLLQARPAADEPV